MSNAEDGVTASSNNSTASEHLDAKQKASDDGQPPASGAQSATSILQIILHIARIVSWLVLIPTGAVIFFLTIGGVFGGFDDGGDVADVLDLVRVFLSAGLMIHVAGILLAILETIKQGTPFEKENAKRLRGIGIAVVEVELAKLAIGIIGSVFLVLNHEKSFEILETPMPFIAAAIAYVLAKVFEEGARLKEEQDYTI